MNNREIMDTLNAAGEAMAAIGESVTLGYNPENVEQKFYVSLRCEGVPFGVQGSGRTPCAAFVRAHANRHDKQQELAREQRIRAEVERRLAAETSAEAA